MSKTGNAKHMAPKQYETFLHLGGWVFSSLFLEWCNRAKNGKRQKKAHLLARLVSLQLNYLSCEMNFPIEKTDRHGPTCAGEILHELFFLSSGEAVTLKKWKHIFSATRNSLQRNTRVQQAHYLGKQSDSKAKSLPMFWYTAVWQDGLARSYLKTYWKHSYKKTVLSLCYKDIVIQWIKRINRNQDLCSSLSLLTTLERLHGFPLNMQGMLP